MDRTEPKVKRKTTMIDLIDAAFALAVREDRRLLASLLDMARLEARLEAGRTRSIGKPVNEVSPPDGDRP